MLYYVCMVGKKPHGNVGKSHNLVKGEFSKHLADFKEKTGLVTKEELKALPIDNIKQLQEKIDLMDRYATAQQKLVDIFGAIGGRVVNSLSLVVDLQAKLWELEETARESGVSPLEYKEYLKARELLSKEMQFIHRHGLDRADVQSKIESRKKKGNDDVIFEVEKGR